MLGLGLSIALVVAAIAALTTASPAVEPESRLALQRRAVPILEFNCNEFPQVCKTQCYGAYCAGNGDLLRYDKPDKKEKRNRRKQAGCEKSGGNRCSVKKNHIIGFQCDEFPYASSSPKGSVTARLNKCVPKAENNKQGGQLNKFYQQQCGSQPCDFQVKMTNGGALCNPGNKMALDIACRTEKINIEQPGAQGPASDSDSSDDGSDMDLAKRDYFKAASIVKRYLTSAGREVELEGDHNIGRSILQVVARNETLHEEQINEDNEEDDFDYMDDNLDIREEIVVKLI
ncbi:hypothetical protein DM02DRAFT_623838 [Periconia macrospinosa]|uniref:Deoxyribonuclease NucA/NucB domain-containing protein n=1 Tax=Periconia macrospinosa TaxID=97972 RepID=A0A2V1E961_9PLEO|nr:hypothetical protein DM02DRAFT_623838 [Periconia macrospinosa]